MKTDIQKLYADFSALYQITTENGVCTNQNDLAKYIGVSKATISGAFRQNANNLTSALVNKLRSKLVADGFITPSSVQANNISNSVVQSPDGSAGISSTDHRLIVAQLLNELAAQRESYERILTLALNKHTDK